MHSDINLAFHVANILCGRTPRYTQLMYECVCEVSNVVFDLSAHRHNIIKCEMQIGNVYAFIIKRRILYREFIYTSLNTRIHNLHFILVLLDVAVRIVKCNLLVKC